MCGIAAFINNEFGLNFLKDALTGLQYRGYDSGGIYLNWGKDLESTATIFDIRKRWEGPFSEEKLEKYSLPPAPPLFGLAHTRWATHGKSCAKNTHPIRYGRVVIVHNGTLENFEQHSTYIVNKGSWLHTETDTEVIAAHIDLFIGHGSTLREAVEKTIEVLDEIGAFVVCCDKSLEIIAYTDGPPLFYTTNGLVCSSLEEFDGFSEYARAISPGVTMEFTNKIIPWELDKAVEIISVPEKVEKFTNTSTYNMFHEIKEQQGLIGQPIPDLYERTVIVGCGSSYYAGMMAAVFLRNFDLDVSVEYATEAKYNRHVRNYILVSQSGESKDVLDFAKELNRASKLLLGSNLDKIIIVQNKSISPLRQIFEVHDVDVVNINAGPEIGVAATKTFTATYLSLISAYGPVKNMEVTDSVLDYCQLHGKMVSRFKNILVLGTESYYPLALETALKLKEIAQIHAEAMPAAEIKHGPIALIDKDTLTLVLNPPGNNKVDNNIRQIGARDGVVINIESDSLLDCVLKVQLISYFAALDKGLDCDKPRNLAKTVTV